MEIVIQAATDLTEQEIRESQLFKDWLSRVPAGRHTRVVVNDVHERGGAIRSLHLTMVGDKRSERFILRTPTVDVLTILTDGEREYIAFVEQYRASMGARVMSNIAGGIDDGESPEDAGLREMSEELTHGVVGGIKIARLVPVPCAASPGMINELVYFMKATLTVGPDELTDLVNELDGKSTGLAEEGEELVVHIVPRKRAYGFILEQGKRFVDGKTIQSLALANIR